MYKTEKDQEWEPNKVVISVDMQKVAVSPRITTSYILQGLVLFNETFTPVGGKAKGKSIKPTGVLWHEAIKGRSAEDVASTFIFFLRQNRDINNFVFWADNCSGQNKNWFLYTALVNEVNRTNGTTNEITIKYFEPGQTFMSADSFHHVIEQGMRKKQSIEDFQDFVDLVDFSGKALVMEHDDFLQLPRGVSQAKYASKKPKLQVMQVIRFERASNEMHWKESNMDEFRSAEFLQRKYVKSLGKEFCRVGKPRGVATEKKNNILPTLLPLLKMFRQAFWEDLPSNDGSVDLLTDRDTSEEAET